MKRGDSTRLNLAKVVLDEALSRSASLRKLKRRLRARGYIKFEQEIEKNRDRDGFLIIESLRLLRM